MVRGLIAMKAALLRNAPPSQKTWAGVGISLGAVFAVASLALGFASLADRQDTIGLVAAMFAIWTLGWSIGPISAGGSVLRSDYFIFLPVSRIRLAAGLTGAALSGRPATVAAVAFSALIVAAVFLGPVAVAIAILACGLQLVLVVLLAEISAAFMGLMSRSRTTALLASLPLALMLASFNTGWAVIPPVIQALKEGMPSSASLLFRLLPSGWGPVAVEAAGAGYWGRAALALAALTALDGVLLLLSAGLIARAATTTATNATRNCTGIASWLLLRAGPLRGVVVRELFTWMRDPSRLMGLCLGLYTGVFTGMLPLAMGVTDLLPFVGLISALYAAMAAMNLYGRDGTALWLTLMTPGVERADVRGRQLAFLLIVGAPAVALTIGLTLLTGHAWAWPWVAALLPALLGASAGLALFLSVFMTAPGPDPHRSRRNPFDRSDSSAAEVGGAQIAFWSTALLIAPAAIAVGANATAPWIGTAVGVALGVLYAGLLGHLAHRRLASHGAEILNLIRHGSVQARATTPKAPPLSLRQGLALSLLTTFGFIAIFPQGLVPLAFKLFGLAQVRVWFLALYLPDPLPIPVALAFVALGGFALRRAREIAGSRRVPLASRRAGE